MLVYIFCGGSLYKENRYKYNDSLGEYTDNNFNNDRTNIYYQSSISNAKPYTATKTCLAWVSGGNTTYPITWMVNSIPRIQTMGVAVSFRLNEGDTISPTDGNSGFTGSNLLLAIFTHK